MQGCSSDPQRGVGGVGVGVCIVIFTAAAAAAEGPQSRLRRMLVCLLDRPSESVGSDPSRWSPVPNHSRLERRTSARYSA
jgi:hypothetical protein